MPEATEKELPLATKEHVAATGEPGSFAIVCDEMGKETLKVLNTGSSRGRMGSVSANVSQAGRELMSEI